ncbi:MAG: HAD family hydrolase [Candidatus Methanospirareceae archaeon]
MEEIEAVLLDLDGVIINSFEAWYQAFNATLREFGRKEMSREEFRNKCWGPDLRYNLEKLKLDKKAEEYCIRKYKELIDKIKIFSGVKDLLRSLKNKYKTGLVTNTPRDNVFAILRWFDLLHFFDAIITGDDVKEGKPNPEIVIKACELLKVTPQRTILVGDTESDFIAGKTAGCIVIGVGKEMNATTRKRLMNKVDIFIENVSDLSHILKL